MDDRMDKTKDGMHEKSRKEWPDIRRKKGREKGVQSRERYRFVDGNKMRGKIEGRRKEGKKGRGNKCGHQSSNMYYKEKE